MATLKGPGPGATYDGSSLRIAIVHARWNPVITNALVTGVHKSLLQAGVKEENILVQHVPGSYELPFAVQAIHQASISGNACFPSVPTISDMAFNADERSPTEPLRTSVDAIVAIGVLIKGETMHFEYIANATSNSLMSIQLTMRVPVIFGLLTVLTEEQGLARAGLTEGSHCHGEDWGNAAVELGYKNKLWKMGELS